MSYRMRGGCIQPRQGIVGDVGTTPPRGGEHLCDYIFGVFSGLQPTTCVGEHSTGVTVEEVAHPVAVMLPRLAAHIYIFPAGGRSLHRQSRIESRIEEVGARWT